MSFLNLAIFDLASNLLVYKLLLIFPIFFMNRKSSKLFLLEDSNLIARLNKSLSLNGFVGCNKIIELQSIFSPRNNLHEI